MGLGLGQIDSADTKKPDPAVGATTFRTLLCKIYRVEEKDMGVR